MESIKFFCKRACEVKSLSELDLPKHLEKIIHSCDLSAEDLIELVRKDKYLFEPGYIYLEVQAEAPQSTEYFDELGIKEHTLSGSGNHWDPG